MSVIERTRCLSMKYVLHIVRNCCYKRIRLPKISAISTRKLYSWNSFEGYSFEYFLVSSTRRNKTSSLLRFCLLIYKAHEQTFVHFSTYYLVHMLNMFNVYISCSGNCPTTHCLSFRRQFYLGTRHCLRDNGLTTGKPRWIYFVFAPTQCIHKAS